MKPKFVNYDEAILALNAAVITLAVRDYERSLVYEREKGTCKEDKGLFLTWREIYGVDVIPSQKMERWFLSAHGQTLSMNSGAEIIRRCRENAARKFARRRKKSKH